jgi:transcriptional regulator with XRE-family HTH domain
VVVTAMQEKENFIAYGVVPTGRKLDRRQQVVAQNIKRYWLQKQANEPGLTQARASKQLGWSHSVVGQYINGRVPAGPKAVFKFAEFFNVTPYDIDPELRGEFAEPPSVDDLRTALSKMSSDDAIKILHLVARRLSHEDLLTAIESLAGLAVDRVARRG